MIDVEHLARVGALGASTDEIVVVDLDSAGGLTTGEIEDAAAAAAKIGGVGVGVASDAVPDPVVPVARALTTNVAANAYGRAEVVPVPDPWRELERMVAAVRSHPVPATVLSQVLRATASGSAVQGMWMESLAYSALLGGKDFRSWRAATGERSRGRSTNTVDVEREGDVLRVVLARPERRNALDAAARGALSDALDIALADTRLRVEVSGEGPDFCAGGDLDEFGTATDLAVAHRLRVDRGPAIRMHQVAPRTTVRVHGASVGAGVELAAFAYRVEARPDATFQLPELAMGLIPGAGGTVSVARRIGRWRAAWLILTGAVLDARRALDWGLVDHVG